MIHMDVGALRQSTFSLGNQFGCSHSVYSLVHYVWMNLISIVHRQAEKGGKFMYSTTHEITC